MYYQLLLAVALRPKSPRHQCKAVFLSFSPLLILGTFSRAIWIAYMYATRSFAIESEFCLSLIERMDMPTEGE
jgi:hypothetical protein